MIPHRRLRLKLDLEADDLDTLAHELRMIADDLEIHERESIPDRASGGLYAGYHLALTCDPEQNHERYVAQLKAWKSPVGEPDE